MKNPTLFGLVDCNNFYCSCERVFQPSLEGFPIVVLSNNDGCIIARSNEAKALGVEMGAPYFKARGLIEQHGIKVFSSNYTLYGDMSARVMSVLAESSPDIEVYSIDESFVDLTGIPDGDGFARILRRKVRQWTGIPVCIGIAQTKTLAKLANRVAKKAPKTGGVLDLSANPAWLEKALAKVDVDDVWGIGHRWAAMLHDRGIHKAAHLRDAADGWVRKRMGVIGHRTAMELRGISCWPLERNVPDKKSCCVSRAFGQVVTELSAVREAVASHAARAAQKLRRDGLVASHITVFLMTDRFDNGDQVLPRSDYESAATAELGGWTADSRRLVGAATAVVERLFRSGRDYKKAGVILPFLEPGACAPRGLFDRPEPKSKNLMAALDAIHAQYGRRSIHFAAEGTKKAWEMKQELRSPRYTTCLSDVPNVRC
jgi:DNA polymerase V